MTWQVEEVVLNLGFDCGFDILDEVWFPPVAPLDPPVALLKRALSDGALAAMIATSSSIQEMIIIFPRDQVKSVIFWNSRRTVRRRVEITTTIPPRLMMLRSMRRLRREIWMAQRG